ncbi:MAG: phenylalanine--tRNA ligase subunit beta [Firmicutes bacterium]|nr:phenylalanine--tRNA ligase subunit beta [Bacillota bacterium]
MRVSYKWLKDYVDIALSPPELARRLTMAGLAVENIEPLGADDYILEFELTPNRADCLSIINIAREIAAITGGQLHLPTISVNEGEGDIHRMAAVEILAPDLCRRYAARVVKNIKIGPAPAWMQERLQAVGVRPINNIVDITNYVMLELGQPLHAFDYDLLAEHRIVVRRAAEGEKITTLDGVARKLDGEMLVIADARRPVALAGVMGGLETEITDQTRTILLESAYFEGVNIRQTSRKVGLHSEASFRFEKGVNLEGAVRAADRAAQLIQELGFGEVVPGVIDEYPRPAEPIEINLRVSRVNEILGTDLNQAAVVEIFSRLQFELTVVDENLIRVKIPSYRWGDLRWEIDLIEEVARLRGYDQIPVTLPEGKVTQGRQTFAQKLINQCRELLTACGLNEVITFSFVSPRVFDLIKLPDTSPLRQAVVITNPLSEEQSIMRTTLIPNLLEVLRRNTSRQQSNLAFFELGNVFFPSGSSVALPKETMTVAGAVLGEQWVGWSGKPVIRDFYYLKGIVEAFLTGIGLQNYSFAPQVNEPTFHPGRTAEIIGAEEVIGVIGEVHPDVLENYNLPGRACVFQIDLERVIQHVQTAKRYTALPKYPFIDRDMAMLVKEEVLADQIARVIAANGQPLLKQFNLFDVYRGTQVPPGYKSLAYTLIYQAEDRTLTDEEVNQQHDRIKQALQAELGVEFR